MIMVSVIIPAYNEEKTISGVVRSTSSSPYVGEVIVIDDASSDETARHARVAGARVIRLSQNVGKGGALDRGVRAAKYDTLLFLDGDLNGVSVDLIQKLTLGVINGKHIMCIALRDLLFRNIPPVLSGTRALKKFLWEAVPETCKRGYKVEIALNYFGHKLGDVGYVKVSNLRHSIKEKKYGVLLGIKKRIKMMGDLATIGIILYLIPKLIKQKKTLKLSFSKLKLLFSKR